MLAKNKFLKLNVKQQIHKLAFEIRNLETASESGEPYPPDALEAYLVFLDETEPAGKLAAAKEKAARALKDSGGAGSEREKTRILNFCYHELLELMDETPGEPYYRVRRFDERREVRRFDTVVVLDNLRSAFNVGSVFRTADGFGVGRLVLTGITPRPPSAKIDRSSMGTVETVRWEYEADVATALARLRAEAYRLYAVETADGATPLEKVRQFERAAFVFGNEEFGLSDAAISACDETVEIPLAGRKNSINVANACAIVCYRAMAAILEGK